MNSFILKAVVMLAIPWYRTDLNLWSLPKSFEYVEFSQGKEMSRRPVSVGDVDYSTLKNFLLSEREGWRYDLSSYAPNRIFKSVDLSVNFLVNNWIVVNYKNAEGEWLQLSKVSENSFVFGK